MIHKLNLSVFSKNITPIYKLFKTIYKNEGNILRSHILKSNASYLLSLDASYSKKKDLPIDVYKEPMAIYFTYSNLLKSRKNYEICEDFYPISLSLQLTDSPGIVHKTLEVLDKTNGDIYELKSKTKMAPICGTRIFECSLHGALPRYIPLDKFKQKINKLEDEFGCDIHLKKL